MYHRPQIQHTHSRWPYPSGHPRMSTWTPAGVLLTFLFTLLFGAVFFFFEVLAGH